MITQPAVMDLNMRAASNGTMILRHLLQPFLLAPLPVMILENMVTYSLKTIREPRALNAKCPICRVNRKAGYGDCAAPLGWTAKLLPPLWVIQANERPLTDKRIVAEN